MVYMYRREREGEKRWWGEDDRGSEREGEISKREDYVNTYMCKLPSLSF